MLMLRSSIFKDLSKKGSTVEKPQRLRVQVHYWYAGHPVVFASCSKRSADVANEIIVEWAEVKQLNTFTQMLYKGSSLWFLLQN